MIDVTLVGIFSHNISHSKASLTSESVMTMSEMKERIAVKKAKYIEKIESLKRQHIGSKNEMSDLIDNLNRQLSMTNDEKSCCEEELSKMRYYISGVENRDTWLLEKQRLQGVVCDLVLH